jgi:hypothetical protein
MKSLVALSKYLGCTNRWQEIREKYSLKWTNGGESLHAMERLFSDDLNYDSMLKDIKELIRIMPPGYSYFLLSPLFVLPFTPEFAV